MPVMPRSASASSNRLRERGALLGIGADRDLVDQQQRSGAALGEVRLQVRDVTAERRQVLLERLRVADVAAHVEDTTPSRSRPSAGRWRPIRVISAHRPTVLSATVLPPAFGPETRSVCPAATLTSLATQRRPPSSISGWRRRGAARLPGASSMPGAAATRSSAMRGGPRTITSRSSAAARPASIASASSAIHPVEAREDTVAPRRRCRTRRA